MSSIKYPVPYTPKERRPGRPLIDLSIGHPSCLTLAEPMVSIGQQIMRTKTLEAMDNEVRWQQRLAQDDDLPVMSQRGWDL